LNVIKTVKLKQFKQVVKILCYVIFLCSMGQVLIVFYYIN